MSLPTLALGTMHLDRYVIESVLGHGSIGVTYRVLDIQGGGTHALKEYFPRAHAGRQLDDSVRPVSAADAQEFALGLTHFAGVAGVLQTIDHPSIVRVLDVFEANGTAYMLMRYEAGETLAVRLARRPLKEAELLRMAIALLSGLEQVHAAGVVHRDIKEEHIVLRADGTPVLIDFGATRVAMFRRRLLMAQGDDSDALGSGDAGCWTDIHALGALLHRLIRRSAPGDVSEEVLGAIRRVLVTDPQERPKNAAAWREDLDAALRSLPLSEQLAPIAPCPVPEPMDPPAMQQTAAMPETPEIMGEIIDLAWECGRAGEDAAEAVGVPAVAVAGDASMFAEAVSAAAETPAIGQVCDDDATTLAPKLSTGATALNAPPDRVQGAAVPRHPGHPKQPAAPLDDAGTINLRRSRSYRLRDAPRLASGRPVLRALWEAVRRRIASGLRALYSATNTRSVVLRAVGRWAARRLTEYGAATIRMVERALVGLSVAMMAVLALLRKTAARLPAASVSLLRVLAAAGASLSVTLRALNRNARWVCALMAASLRRSAAKVFAPAPMVAQAVVEGAAVETGVTSGAVSPSSADPDFEEAPASAAGDGEPVPAAASAVILPLPGPASGRAQARVPASSGPRTIRWGRVANIAATACLCFAAAALGILIARPPPPVVRYAPPTSLALVETIQSELAPAVTSPSEPAAADSPIAERRDELNAEGVDTFVGPDSPVSPGVPTTRAAAAADPVISYAGSTAEIQAASPPAPAHEAVAAASSAPADTGFESPAAEAAAMDTQIAATDNPPADATLEYLAAEAAAMEAQTPATADAPAVSTASADSEPRVVEPDVGALLAAAATDVDALRLTGPEGHNALEKYRRVLDIDPGNAAARQGVQTIGWRYVDLAHAAMANGDFETASRHLDRAEQIAPGEQAVVRARDELDARDRVSAGERVVTQPSIEPPAPSVEQEVNVAAAGKSSASDSAAPVSNTPVSSQPVIVQRLEEILERGAVAAGLPLVAPPKSDSRGEEIRERWGSSSP